MQIKLNRTFLIVIFFLGAILSNLVFVSCEDDYFYEKETPEFLGGSIYEYLEKDGNFKYFIRLIDDLDYKEVLSKTGSKTLFPVRDEAFDRFFKGNSYGVSSYEGLSFAQKRGIMNISMVNMAYLSYMLSNSSDSDELGEGLALKHKTTNTYLDSIPFVKNKALLENPYFARFSETGLYLMNNSENSPIIHFTSLFMKTKGVTNFDFSKLYNGEVYAGDDIFVNGVKVIERDIICKNGYVHVLEDLMLPGKDMAQIIHDNGETKLFDRLLSKFCAPYFYNNKNKSIHDFYDGSAPERPLLPATDSIFVKVYFTPDNNYDPSFLPLTNYGLLYFDPASSDYGSEQDMGAMFVPTDKAMAEYIEGEKGQYLKDAYGSWENIPTPLLALFLKNHQKKSFITSLPHTWPTLTDESSFDLNISESDITKTYVGTNGAVYISDKVFPPIDYQCVYASVLVSENTKIMNWTILDKTMKFNLYLRSMENMYNLILPVDEAFDNYRDPISWAKGVGARQIWSFKYIEVQNRVVADTYSADASGNKGAFITRITDPVVIRNRLMDIVNMHIVIGNKSGNAMSGYIDDGQTQYALTKEGATIKIGGAGDNVTMTGGGDIEANTPPAEITINSATGNKSRYDSDNGRTFFTNRILQDPVSSVYTILGKHSEYTAFFNLLKGDERVYNYFAGDKEIVSIFDLKKTTSSTGIGYVVNSFNNFRYTVFIPTQQALNKAFAENDKLFTWDQIADDTDYDSKKEKTLYLLNFLKYHFMDNSAYISGKPINRMRYETASRNESNKFHRLILNSDGNDLEIECEGTINNVPVKAKVLKNNGLYNVMGRDYIVNSGQENQILASSRSVIHLIDTALKFE